MLLLARPSTGKPHLSISYGVLAAQRLEDSDIIVNGILQDTDRPLMFLRKGEVVAFPKTAQATDLMADAPSPVAPKQLDELHIALTLLKEKA